MTMWIIGMMGSGKSTVGAAAASRLGVAFIDTDEIVVEMTGQEIADLWAEVGEEGFRQVERRAVATVPESGVIAAAGGGAILDAVNRSHMSAGAPVVWLRADAATLARRLADDGTRPLLEDDVPHDFALARILEDRETLYEDLATDMVDTEGRRIDDVVEDIIRIWDR